MAKIIVERPRHGGGFKTPKGWCKTLQGLPMEEWHSTESMRRPWRVGRKGFNENLAPLCRFLRSRVGRAWNEVNSEIRERVNLDSAVQLHIWQHVTQYVCIKPIVSNGQLLNLSGRRLHEMFYVDPATGILRENTQRRWRRQSQRQPADYIRIDRWNQYRKLNGIWYRVRLKPLPDEPTQEWDMIFKKLCSNIGRSNLVEYYGTYGYAVEKRQLNTKEIAALRSGNSRAWQRAR
jgi:hypothetical protein